MKLAGLFMTGLIWASSAFGVSRVGGGTLSNDWMGFSLSTPPEYSDYTIYPQEDIQLRGRLRITRFGNAFEQARINIYMLPNERADLGAIQDRGQFRQAFAGWTSLALPDACVEGFLAQGSGAVTITLGWGAGRGIVLVGVDERDVVEGLTMMAKSVQVTPGSCAWK